MKKLILVTILTLGSFNLQAAQMKQVWCQTDSFVNTIAIHINESGEFVITQNANTLGSGHALIFHAQDNFVVIDLYEKSERVGLLLAMNSDAPLSRLNYKGQEIGPDNFVCQLDPLITP